MVRRSVVVLALAVVPFIAIPTALVPEAGAAPAADIQACLHGGWQTFTEASGQPFTNEGQCVAYAIHHPVSLADLAGSLTGTTSLFGAPGVCSFLGQSFAATYPAGSAVGTVTLQMDGCVTLAIPPAPIPFVGTLAMATGVGTLDGTATGPISTAFDPAGNLFPASATLVLSVTSGTGLFTGTTGTLHLSLQWPQLGSNSFDGTIAPA